MFFNYPVKLELQEEGGYLVQFPDFPEAITQGESIEDALEQAQDCLDEAIANRIVMQLEIPKASMRRKNQYEIMLNATMSAKTALYLAIRSQHLTKSALAKKLGCDEKEIRRLVDPYYHGSKLPRIEHALNMLGQQLVVGVTDYRTPS
jgi:antitoxin HicB